MGVLFYSDKSRMAFADDQFSFSNEEAIKSMVPSQKKILILKELNTYYVKCFGDTIPDFLLHSFSGGLCSYTVPKIYPENLFEINFHNSVGKTCIGPVHVCIENKKIPEELYNSMLDYIAEKYANLVFSFNVPLGQSYRKSTAGEDIAYIEYLFLKKYLLDSSPNLNEIASIILANPHMKLHAEQRISSIDEAPYINPGSLIKTLMKTDGFVLLPSGHHLLETGLGKALNRQTSKSLYPSQVYQEHKYHTVDTNENRFLKYFLKRIQHRLNGLASTVRATSGGYLNPDIEDNLKKISQKADMFLNDPFWHDVGMMSFVPSNSQVLQRREGYRQLFRLYSLLQLCTRCFFDETDFRNLLETKDTPTLFEYWSFFAIKDVLDGIKKPISSDIIVSKDSLEQKINVEISIQYEDNISLLFNKTYAGSLQYQPCETVFNDSDIRESYSHDLRPDIVLTKGKRLLILDAKYKGHRSGFYCEDEFGGISSWKNEDIDKMHTYRDAIHDVVGAFILYPGEESGIYPAHGAKKYYEGVGAIPLKPQTGAVPSQKHLDNIKQIILDFITED